MRIKLTTVHVLAGCKDCSWEAARYLVAQRLAAQHAKKEKHRVSVEVCKVGFYDGRTVKSKG